MNLSQYQSVLDILERLKSLDIEKKLMEAYPTEPNPAKVNIGNYNAEVFMANYHRLIHQFEAELGNSQNSLLLPYQYNFQNEYGSSHLQQDLSYLYSNINDRNFPGAEGYLNRLVYYQMVHGFWDRSSVNVHSLRGIQVSKLESKLKFIEEHLEASIKSNKEFSKVLNKQKEDLDRLVNEKKQQMLDINTAFVTAQNQAQQISSFLNDSKAYVSTIDGIIVKQEANFDQTKANIESQTESFGGLKKELEKTLEGANTSFGKFKEQLEFISGKKEFIEKKEKEIIKLTGKAADGALGHTFYNRQKMLNISTWSWLGILVAIVIGAGFWIHFVFTNISANTGLAWVDLLINALKASPALILVGFAINQYSKERSLKEEYAFKAAVAMTINAYADAITEAFKEEDKSREQMILESIQKVYLPPKFYQEDHNGLFNNGSKELRETLKSLAESLKEIKKP